MTTLDVVLDEAGDIADAVAKEMRIEPVRTVLQVTGIVLHAASGATFTINAAEVERIRQARALGEASGRSAYEASKQDFHKKKEP